MWKPTTASKKNSLAEDNKTTSLEWLTVVEHSKAL
jgi:hypothetical protein